MKSNGPVLHTDNYNLRKLSIMDAYRRADGDEGGRLFLEIETFSNQKHSYALSPPRIPSKSDLFCWQYLIMVASAFCMICFSGWLAMKLSHRNIMKQGFSELNKTITDNSITESIVKLYHEINDIPIEIFTCKEITVNITSPKENKQRLPITIIIGDMPKLWKSRIIDQTLFPVNSVFLQYVGNLSVPNNEISQLRFAINAIFNGVINQDKSRSSIIFYNYDLKNSIELAALANTSIMVEPKILNGRKTLQTSQISEDKKRVLIIMEYLEGKENSFNKIYRGIHGFQINVKIYHKMTAMKTIRDIYKFIMDL